MKLENTLKYRSVWMGVAMLWVVLYHTSGTLAGYSFFKNIGYGGVDLCLFASGVGCYYSLSKNDNVFEFTKRRLFRIFPTYWCFLPFWFVYAFKAFEMKVPDVIGNIFGVQNFTGKGNAFNWYISAILLFYILAPYLKMLCDKVGSLPKQLLVIALLFAFSVPFWNSFTYIITVSRLPIFYIGMVFAKSSKDGVKLGYKNMIPYTLAMIAGFVLLWVSFEYLSDYRWNNGLYWYPFILITPGLCVCLSFIMSLLDKSKFTSWIVSLLSLVGKYSFEVYLVHILIYDSVNYMINNGVLDGEKIVYALALCAIPFACLLLNYLTKLVTKTLPSIIKGK
ncbi:MAG: acyltransferase [Ruminococcus sp.]|nr:acyltransferase [Ruminococcus sp.]